MSSTSEETPPMMDCETCNGKGKNTRGQRCLDCNGTGKQEEELISCSVCGHTNFTDPALDDLEAACDCDCHDMPEDEGDVTS